MPTFTVIVFLGSFQTINYSRRYLDRMGRLFCLFIAAVVVNGCALSLAQDQEIAEANRRARSFSLNAEFEFPEYRMVADITVEASPESEYLFRAKATMEILQSSEFRVEKVFNVPKLIADDRGAKGTGGVIHAGPFTKFDQHEWLFLDEKVHNLQGKIVNLATLNAKRHPLNLSETIDVDSPLCTDMASIQPYDWPLFTFAAFERHWKERDIYRYTFGKDRLCVFASTVGGLLETHWVKPSNKVVGVCKVTFEEDRIVRNQLYVYSKPIDIKKVDLKEGWPYRESKIIWEKKGVGAYPKTVLTTMRSEFGKPDSVFLVANIRLFCPGEHEFDFRRAQVQKQIDNARVAEKPDALKTNR